MLPPSMRGDAATSADAKKDASAPAPAPTAAARAAADAAAPATPPETRLYKGTGTFINQKPPLPVPQSQLQEASLNFEALDVARSRR
jgi:hypothetical protein